jgi:hypothetical protein
LNSNWISRPFWPREKTKNQPISYHPSSSCINSFSICIICLITVWLRFFLVFLCG